MMKYTVLGKTGLRVSRLGFGCMRLPMTESGRVDRDVAVPMLRRAVELGVTYFDTAIMYCNGDSQRVLGEALEDMRERVVLSTKNHLHEADDDSWWARLEESLRFLRTDSIDVYNLHGMSWATWERNIRGSEGKLRLLQKAKEQGMIKHICCSFHDEPENLAKLAETGVFESVTVQYNLLDRRLAESIARADELGLGVVAMGPVGGGRLGVESDRIKELTQGEAESTPEAALRFVLANPHVDVALAGMGSMSMLEENVRIVSEKEPFTDELIQSIDAEVQRAKQRRGVPCTACGYCMPCPFDVDIPGNFDVFNQFCAYGLTDSAQRAYDRLDRGAAHCTECGACIPKCPQKIDIPGMLRQVVSRLDRKFEDFGTLATLAGAADGTVRTRLTVKNLTGEPLSPVVTPSLAGGAQAEPNALAVDEMDPFSSRVLVADVRVPDGLGYLQGEVRTECGTETRDNAVFLPFFLVPQGRIRWHEALLLADDVSGRADIADTHGLRIGLQRTEEGIDAVLDVRSKLDGLARPGEAGGARLELYLDMRPDDQGFATAPYAPGVDQLILSLGESGYRSQSGNAYRLDQRNEPTQEGVRVSMTLRYDDFCQKGWPRPKRIGLDVMLVVAEEDGRELGHATFGRQGGLWRNPARFTAAYLV